MNHRPLREFTTKRRALPLGRHTHLVGVLNLTPDSFSDGGDFIDAAAAQARLCGMVDAGAAIIDIGGESTRPDHRPVSAEEEVARVVPFIKSIRARADALISIDTSKAVVAAAALEAGVDLVNDVWGAQRDPEMAATIGRHGAACILTHNRAAEKAGQGDIVEVVADFLRKSVAQALNAGVSETSIALDPGFGFGKTFDENWELLRRLPELRAIGYPLLIGTSRKSMIAGLLDLPDPKTRLFGTLATTALAIQGGADFIRVHDVRENAECARVIDHCIYHEQGQN